MIVSFKKKKMAVVGVTAIATILLCTLAMAEGISAQQGDAILNELKQIRTLLEKQQRQNVPSPEAPATPERVRLKIGKHNMLGKKEAPLVMVEFTDYQCPFCNRFYTTTFPDLKREYIDKGKVLFIARDYPLDFHPYAMKAARATHCAGDQDKFWQMKDAMMMNFNRLDDDVITTLGRSAGLDMAKYQSCLDTGKYAAEIKEDIASANAIGINGTPSFVVGKINGDYIEGYRIVGAQPFAEFKKVIEDINAGKQ